MIWTVIRWRRWIVKLSSQKLRKLFSDKNISSEAKKRSYSYYFTSISFFFETGRRLNGYRRDTIWEIAGSTKGSINMNRICEQRNYLAFLRRTMRKGGLQNVTLRFSKRHSEKKKESVISLMGLSEWISDLWKVGL